MFKYIPLILIPFILLTGCAAKQTPPPVVETIYIREKVEISPIYLARCIPNKPMQQDRYMKLSLSERESYLSEYIIHLMGVLGKCNMQLEYIEKPQTN